MELDYWKDFLVLTETMNFSETAEQRNISQSSLSKHIRILEEEYGGPFFDRTTRKIYLNERGRMALPYARELLSSENELRKKLKRYDDRKKNRLKLGVVRNFQAYGIDKLFTGFEEQYPEYRLTLAEEDMMGLIRSYQAGTINLFCTYRIQERPLDFNFIPVGEGEFGAVGRRGSLYDQPGPIRPEDLEEAQLFFPTAGSDFHALLLKRFEDSGVVPNIVSESGTFGSFDLARAGDGIALQHKELFLSYDKKKDLFWRPLTPSVSYEYGLGYRDYGKLTRPEKMFVEFMKEQHIAR